MDNSGSPIESKTEIDSQTISRPGCVTILALGVLIITIINLLRLILSITSWDFLKSWPGVSPLYMVTTGLIWTLIGSFLFFGLWTGKKWAPKLVQAVALSYALYYWLDHVFLEDHPARGAVGAQRALLPVNWQFAVVATVACLAYVVWVLSRPKVKAYFGVAESNAGNDPTVE
jgi:hypothetical protein